MAAPKRAPDEFNPREVERDLRRQLSLINRRVPRDIEVRVRDIATTITDVLPRAGELGPGSRDLFVLQRTADDYLPTALQTYLNLPAGAIVAAGKSADQVLVEQLDVMAAQMREVKAAIQRKDSDALVAHGRFLEQKFGKGVLPLPGTANGPLPARRPSPVAAIKRTNNMALVSLGLGVFGIFAHVVPIIGGMTAALLAIITGFVARSQIKRTGEDGARLALYGIVLGAVHLAVIFLVLLFFGAALIALVHAIFP